MKALNYSQNYFSMKSEKTVADANTRQKGEWLTAEVVKRYRDAVERQPSKDMQSIGERRRLRLELEEKYGITEIEAINILNGSSIGDYINKYERRKKKAELKKGGNDNAEEQMEE